MKRTLTLLLMFIFHFAYSGPHTVQKGETYADIARLYHISVDTLIKANSDKKAYSGSIVEIPMINSIYDLGGSALFRQISFNFGNSRKGRIAYNSGQRKLNHRNMNVHSIIKDYEKAIYYGNIDALYELGKYYVYGQFCYNQSFDCDINKNIEQFQRGLELLQISAIISENTNALVDLAIACGHEKSPIRNPYLCLSMLEAYQEYYHKDLKDLLCYMYENGYGIKTNYIKAYINCPSSTLVTGYTETHREKILEKIDTMSNNIEAARYGVGLESNILLAIGMKYYHNDVLEPEGLFWLHRAANMDNADANWILAGILAENKIRTGSAGSDTQKQAIYFARKAADLGNDDAAEYVESYEEYIKQKEKYERQQMIAYAQRKAERKEQRKQQWLNFAGTLLQAGAQTYMAIETAKMQNNPYALSYQMPQSQFGQMSDAQWLSRNQKALEQIMAYTWNKTYADWNGTPMMPTDMSAVDLGTDMSPGSPLWMWTQQQRINELQTQNSRMQFEVNAFYKEQADRITQQIMENPLQPIPGYVDYTGNWVSYDDIAAQNSFEPNDVAAAPHRNESLEKAKNYYSERYGNVTCPICHGMKYCQTCNGYKVYSSSFTSGQVDCPNCWFKNGKRTGLCSKCQGKGYVYGLRH